MERHYLMRSSTSMNEARLLLPLLVIILGAFPSWASRGLLFTVASNPPSLLWLTIKCNEAFDHVFRAAFSFEKQSISPV